MTRFIYAAILFGSLLVARPTWADDPSNGRFLQKNIQTQAALLGVDYSPDGKRVVAGGLGRDIIVYDVESGKPVLTLKGHTDDVVTVKYSPNGRYIASGGVDRALILWDAITGELLRKNTDHTDYVRDVAFSPDSKQLASAGWDGQVLVFDALGGQRIASLKAAGAGAPTAAAAYDKAKTSKGRAGNVTSVAFSPDGSELLTASGDHQLRLWNTANWEQKATLTGHNDEVWDARYSPNGQYVVSGAWDNTARVWSLADRRCTRTIPAHVSDVWATAFSPDGQLIATGGGDRKVKFWDVATGTLVQDVSGDLHTAEVENLAFSPNGQTLVSVSRDGSLKFWRVPSPDDRVAAFADYELEKWARKGEFEKSDEYQKRLAKRFEHLQELQEMARQQMLHAYGNTANWQSFALGDYNADAETYALTSALWPVNFKVKVSPKEAARFREGFARRTFGTPELAFQLGAIVLKSAPVVVSFNGEAHTYSLTR